jgi:hypothetical protein
MLSEKLIDYLWFYVHSNFHLYGDVTVDGEGLENFDLCSAFRAFEQKRIFIVQNLYDTNFDAPDAHFD